MIHQYDGATYNETTDRNRLDSQLGSVRDYMLSHDWVTLREMSVHLGFPEASVSARLRDLRKLRNGSYNIARRRYVNGLFEYRMMDAGELA